MRRWVTKGWGRTVAGRLCVWGWMGWRGVCAARRVVGLFVDARGEEGSSYHSLATALQDHGEVEVDLPALEPPRSQSTAAQRGSSVKRAAWGGWEEEDAGDAGQCCAARADDGATESTLVAARCHSNERAPARRAQPPARIRTVMPDRQGKGRSRCAWHRAGLHAGRERTLQVPSEAGDPRL